MPPAPWAGGPSGERSVIGGRSIRKLTPPEKMPAVKGTVGALNVIAITVQFDHDNDGVEDTIQGDDFIDQGRDKAFFEAVLTAVAQYYSDVSDGMLTLNFTVTDNLYTLAEDMGYYGDQTRGGAEAVIRDAVYAADNDVDFSLYDAVVVFHAGVGEESLGQGDGPLYIWSQRVRFPPINVDGVDISGGLVVPEKEQRGNASIVGVVAHELGHELGLPDLYDVDGTSMGIGNWGLMGYGAWGNNGATPSELEAWSKVFLGWASVITLSSEQTSYLLPPASEGNTVIKLNARGYPDSEEYFLLEYRRRTSWDEFLPGQGLLIWHVDEEVGRLPNTGLGCNDNRWACNEVNADEAHKLLDLEEADGLEDLDFLRNSGDANDPFRADNAASFPGATAPDSGNYAGQATGISVTNISSPGETISFNLALGFRVASVSIVDANTVDVVYNRAVHPSPSAASYSLSLVDGGSAVNPASASLQADGSTVRLSFTNPISSSDIYRLTINNERDASSAFLQFNPTAMDNPFGTNAAGALNGHAVWDAAGNPYYITDDIIIENHLSLTISEGAVIKIKNLAPSGEVDISVRGLLRVLGSQTNPVLISSAARSPSQGFWGTIRFESEADDRSVISHAILEYGTTGVTLSSASPTISSSTFRSFSETGIVGFGSSSPIIVGSAFSNNTLGLSCWEDSEPQIAGNLITANMRGIVCGGSAIPTIIGNDFNGNTEIGLSVQDQVGALNPTIVGNNFRNHSASNNVGIYSFNNPVNAPHNYFSNNTFNVGGMNTSEHISQQLSNPVDWQFSPAASSFRNPGYSRSISFIAPGSTLYIQLQGTGGDTATNSIIALVKSSATDPTGVFVHLNETSGETSIYRTAENPETLASLGSSTDQSLYRLGALAGETLVATYPPDISPSANAIIQQCLSGDANKDDFVDIKDVISLIRIAIALDPQPQTTEDLCLQDTDQNGTVNILDAIQATRILLNL